jgi:Ribosome biogenesis protein SLX9
MKHARLMSKVTKSTSTKPRRRRPNNKLVATLDSLASALPDDNEVTRGTGNDARDQVNIIKRKSLKSRPGALKRREKLDKGERDRFTKNMAQLATTTSQAGDPSNKWATLRGFISQTLEKRSHAPIGSS